MWLKMKNELKEEFKSNPSLVSIKSTVWFRVKFCTWICLSHCSESSVCPVKPWNVWLISSVSQNVFFPSMLLLNLGKSKRFSFEYFKAENRRNMANVILMLSPFQITLILISVLWLVIRFENNSLWPICFPVLVFLNKVAWYIAIRKLAIIYFQIRKLNSIYVFSLIAENSVFTYHRKI